MAKLLQAFTIARNILASDTLRSSERAAKYVGLVGDGLNHSAYSRLSKGQTNDVSALANYTGLFTKTADGGYGTTRLNYHYRELDRQNRPDAWQWLITRTLWHYVVPNGTVSPINRTAASEGYQFNFFKNVLSLTSFLGGLPEDDRYLYFHELCILLNEDEIWGKSAVDWFQKLLDTRSSGTVNRERRLLDDLEPEFHIPRDNFNTVLVKACRQTGLFEYKIKGGGPVGFALSSALSSVLQKRVRHIVDTDLDHGDPVSHWNEFIEEHDKDLPLEVEFENQNEEYEEHNEEDPFGPEDLPKLCETANTDFENAGLQFDLEFVERFVAACLTKPFVILTGLSGSGKTKLAEAFAAWISPKTYQLIDPFAEGQTIKSVRTEYKVVAADSISVVLETPISDNGSAAKLTTIPRDLIEQWASAIQEQGYTFETRAREIREYVAEKTNHDTQINSFESHLKACAFALIEARADGSRNPPFKIVPVGPDWTSGEYVLGYPDALDSNNYVRRPALDVLLSAQRNRTIPHFLILDEMNLSHVERYFAEILSALEVTQPIELFSSDENASRSGVPAIIPRLPKNLIIVGTVNIDETTYLFSPKVLDRANVLEFKVSKEEIKDYLLEPRDIDISEISGKGASFAHVFLNEMHSDWKLTDEQLQVISVEMELFFEVLQQAGSEFGYRVAKEISKFIYHLMRLSPGEGSLYAAIDTQVNQKLLPKLHGSERVLKPILWGLAALCSVARRWEADADGKQVLTNREEILDLATKTMSLKTESPFRDAPPAPYLPVSFEKCLRMNERLQRNGFTSFAEA